MADRPLPSKASAASPSKSAPATPSRQVVAPEQDGQPLDGIVRTLFGLSWGRARELLVRGKIAVDGRTTTRGTTKVRAGATVVLDLAARKPNLEKEELAREAFVYVDSHVVVVDKPSGVSTVPFDPGGMAASLAVRARRPGDEVTLDQRVRAALARRERARGRSGPPPEIGVVHRLDKETSGLVVFTRSWAAKKALTQAFRVHAVHRRYLALVHGTPKDQTITTHFVEDRGDGVRGSVEHRHGRRHAVGSEKTQRAVTHIEVVERFPPLAGGGGAGQPVTLVACRLETGRTHQIRIHLAEAGYPVLGERVYTRGHGGPLVPAPRVMLHAAELGFVHPGAEERGEGVEGVEGEEGEEGEEMRWTSPLPADFEEMLAFLRGPPPPPTDSRSAAGSSSRATRVTRRR